MWQMEWQWLATIKFAGARGRGREGSSPDLSFI